MRLRIYLRVWWWARKRALEHVASEYPEVMIGQADWTVKMLRQVPETRWLRRHVLRRRTRLLVVFAGVPTGVTLVRDMNAPTRATFTVEDPLALLARLKTDK